MPADDRCPGLALTLDVPPRPLWVVADATRLAQAFSNLLNNAAKYTERGGQIRVSMATADNTASVTVADTGLGIEPRMLPLVFEMFTQLQAHRDRAQGGLGIGLTLAKRLIELHGGTIKAQSEGVGRGSRFTVRLTTAPAPAPEAEVAAAPTPVASDSRPAACSSPRTIRMRPR